MQIKENIKKLKELAAVPVTNDSDTKRVEIIMLKFKEEPAIIDKAISRIVNNTDWPFKLTVYDNRLNTPNTSRIWNKLIQESTCDYVLIIDSDAFVPVKQYYSEGEEKEMKQDGPCWLTRMMESIDVTGVVIPVSSAPGGAHQHVSGPGPYPSYTLNQDIWSGYCFLIDKKLILKNEFPNTGPFDERFYIYGQDSEFAYRHSAIMRQDVYVEHIGGYSFKRDPIREYDKIYARKLFQYLTKKK